MATKHSAEEIQRLLEGYRQRTGTRVDYCSEQGITPNTLAYYLRRQKSQGRPRLARVKLAPQGIGGAGSFALVLRNGRRIESAWNFRDPDLARLIRVAEAE